MCCGVLGMYVLCTLVMRKCLCFTVFMWSIIRSVRDGLRGVIDRDWVHSNLRSVRDGLRDFIIILRCFIRFRSDRDGLRVFVGI